MGQLCFSSWCEPHQLGSGMSRILEPPPRGKFLAIAEVLGRIVKLLDNQSLRSLGEVKPKARGEIGLVATATLRNASIALVLQYSTGHPF